jgi:uncharacterized damage-inducible protein DinB
MKLVELLLPEFDLEMANTRRLLESLPQDKLDWRPYEKSWTLAGLATHILMIPHWGTVTFTTESFDLPEGGGPRNEPVTSVAEALERFDAHVAEVRPVLAAQRDGQLEAEWSMSVGGRPLFSRPRHAVWRGMILNHLIHHRGQLSVFLRLAGAPLPGIYGPTADDRI